MSSTKPIDSLIQRQVDVADVIPLTALRKGHLELLEVTLTEDVPSVDRRVRDLILPTVVS